MVPPRAFIRSPVLRGARSTTREFSLIWARALPAVPCCCRPVLAAPVPIDISRVLRCFQHEGDWPLLFLALARSALSGTHRSSTSTTSAVSAVVPGIRFQIFGPPSNRTTSSDGQRSAYPSPAGLFSLGAAQHRRHAAGRSRSSARTRDPSRKADMNGHINPTAAGSSAQAGDRSCHLPA